MKNWLSLLKRMQIHRIFSIFLAGILLIIITACSGINAQGANPQNPAVQAGGANNPYKYGGDNYTKYRMSTDHKVTNEANQKEQNQANLFINRQTLISATKESEILYPGAETPLGRVKKEAELPIITEEEFQHPEPGGLIQREPDIRKRFQKRIDTVTESVGEASKFLPEKAEEALSRPEMQRNPAVGK